MYIFIFIITLLINFSVICMEKIDGNTQLSNQLFSCASKGNSKQCELLLAQGADVHVVDKEGRSVLEEAVKSGDIRTVKVVLNAGADVNHLNIYDGDALTWAAQFKHPAIAQLLIDAGANVNHLPRDGQSAFKAVCENGWLDFAQLFIDRKVDVNLGSLRVPSALYMAACHNHEHIVDLLLAAGASTSNKGASSSPLIAASMNGSIAIVEKLIQAGALVDEVTHDGSTALIWAGINARVEIARMLMNAGANPYHRDNEQRTALMRAAERSNFRAQTCTLLVSGMLTYPHEQCLYTALFCLKKLNTEFSGVYSGELRKKIKEYMVDVIKEENKLITRCEIEKIQNTELKERLLQLLS